MPQQADSHVYASILDWMKDLINMIERNEDIKNVNPNAWNYLNVNGRIDEKDIVENERRIMEFFKTIKAIHVMIAFLSYGKEDRSYIENPAFNPTEVCDPRKESDTSIL